MSGNDNKEVKLKDFKGLRFNINVSEEGLKKLSKASLILSWIWRVTTIALFIALLFDVKGSPELWALNEEDTLYQAQQQQPSFMIDWTDRIDNTKTYEHVFVWAQRFSVWACFTFVMLGLQLFTLRKKVKILEGKLKREYQSI